MCCRLGLTLCMETSRRETMEVARLPLSGVPLGSDQLDTLDALGSLSHAATTTVGRSRFLPSGHRL